MLFNLTPILFNIKFPTPTFHLVTWSQYSLLLLIQFFSVAVSLFPSALNSQFLLVWCHTPWVQYYFVKILRGLFSRFHLTEVFNVVSLLLALLLIWTFSPRISRYITWSVSIISWYIVPSIVAFAFCVFWGLTLSWFSGACIVCKILTSAELTSSGSCIFSAQISSRTFLVIVFVCWWYAVFRIVKPRTWQSDTLAWSKCVWILGHVLSRIGRSKLFSNSLFKVIQFLINYILISINCFGVKEFPDAVAKSCNSLTSFYIIINGWAIPKTLCRNVSTFLVGLPVQLIRKLRRDGQ